MLFSTLPLVASTGLQQINSSSYDGPKCRRELTSATRSRLSLLLVHPLVNIQAVAHEVFWLEPESNLLLCAIRAVASVDDVSVEQGVCQST